MTEDDITKIILRHNQWSVRSGIRHVRSHLEPKLRAQAKRYLAWCEKNDVNAEMFLDAHCEYRISTGHKLQDLAFLPSAKALERWRSWIEGKQLRQQTDNRLASEMLHRPPVDRRLRPHQEAFKSSYIGREGLCAIYQEHTGGFNPQSRYCKRCPAQASCIEKGTRRPA